MIQILAPEKDRKTNIGIPCSSCRENPSIVRMRIGDEREATSIRLCVDCRDDLLLGLIRNKDGVTTMTKTKMTIEMEVTVSQALALKAMFEYWNQLSSWGSSRYVAFYCDGDGNFHPKCKVTTDSELPKLTDELRKIAVKYDNNGHRQYDFDGITWELD